MAEEPKRNIDWEKIEAEYRAGQLSVSEIGRLNSCSHTAINKRAKREGWTRDLAAKVRQEVSARLVSEGVSATNARETVELAAERDIQLIREHRRDISNGRMAVKELVDELLDAGRNRDEIEEAIEHETASDQNGKRRAMMLKAVSLGTRAGVASNLSVALKNLVTIERQAFGLENGLPPDGDGDGGKPVFNINFVKSKNPDGSTN